MVAKRTFNRVSIVKKELKSLLDQLPESELQVAKRFLEYLRDTGDPLPKRLVEAPEDDEPLTEADRLALAASEEDVKAGRVYALEEIKREFRQK